MTFFQKFIVMAYRYLAAAVLLTILSTGVGYAFVTLLYTVNSTWVAPILISQTHERILQLKGELFRSQEAADSLQSTLTALGAESLVLTDEEAMLAPLLEKAQGIQQLQQSEDRQLANRLVPLSRDKTADIARTANVVLNLRRQEASVDSELAAGLITKDDALRTLAAFNTIRAASTDLERAGVGLDQQIKDLRHSADTLGGKKGTSGPALEVLSRVAQFQSQLFHIRLKLNQNKVESANKTSELAKVKEIVATLSDSPYYRVTQSKEPLSFAFIPYTNEQAVKVGENVYDCAVQVFWCHKVGVVKKIHRDEEHGQHPLFKVDMRGFLVEMQLTEPRAAKSRVVFLGGSPLFL